MSCLFDSLSRFTNRSSDDLRQQIVSYLSTNPKLMEDTTFQDMMSWESQNANEYMESMRRSSTWGGAIEIKAFVNIYRANVIVHIPHHQRTVEFVYNEAEKHTFPFVNILWTGNHFVPILPRAETTSVAVRPP